MSEVGLLVFRVEQNLPKLHTLPRRRRVGVVVMLRGRAGLRGMDERLDAIIN